MDGIRTDRAAVDDQTLIKRLNTLGSRIRAKVGRRQVRIVLPKPGFVNPEIPEETNSLLYVVSTSGDLKRWLRTVRQS
jgi:hypothetical protein